MALFSASTRPLAWAGFVLVGFSCVWLVFLLVAGAGPEPEEARDAAAQTAASEAAAAPAPAAQGAQTTAAAAAPNASPNVSTLTPAAAIPGALHAATRTDEQRTTAPTPFGQAASNGAAQAFDGATAQPPQQQQAAPAPAPQQAAPVQTASVQMPARAAAPTPQQQQTAAPAGPSVRDLTVGLAIQGHTVHAALSGRDSSTTLSVSGRTLTRDACLQWLSGSRGSLRAAGIHIVVATNGTQSWTFML